MTCYNFTTTMWYLSRKCLDKFDFIIPEAMPKDDAAEFVGKLYYIVRCVDILSSSLIKIQWPGVIDNEQKEKRED